MLEVATGAWLFLEPLNLNTEALISQSDPPTVYLHFKNTQVLGDY